jgi:hypothetical protein
MENDKKAILALAQEGGFGTREKKERVNREMRHMHHHAIECLSEGNGNGIL